MTKFAVNYWGSHPADGNDDCWSGDDFETLEEAVHCFHNPDLRNNPRFIELDGPGVYDVRENLEHREESKEDSDWHRETQHQAAMAFGVQGWNDYEGYEGNPED